MKEYTVMGSHPGDGGVYKANSPEEALAKHFLLDEEECPLETMIDSIVSFGFGDYEVKEIKS